MAFDAPPGLDREIMTRVLQGLSNTVAGRPGDAGLVPDASFAQVAPMDDTLDVPAAPGQAPPDDGQEHMAATTGTYAWGGYENGRIPTKALKAIGQGSHKLEAGAADSWTAMREAAAADGITLSLTDSYRSFDQQVATRKNKGHLVATATPGRSVHGWGRAVDANVKSPETLAWLQANAGRFGWVNPAWAKAKGKNHEPWHWEFTGGGS